MPLRPLVVALLACVALGRAAPAAAQSYEGLGSLERDAADQALREGGYVVEPTPEGKTVGKIHVVTLEVFSERDLFLPVFNRLHRTTRPYTLEREVLLRPGALYDRAVVEETVRAFQADVDLTSVVVMLPVRSATPGQVDLLVVTRDVWSLRLNSDFEIQGLRVGTGEGLFSFIDGRILFLALSLSENNLLGLRKRVSVDFTMDQGAFAIGPTYSDPNVHGTRLVFAARARALYGREDGDLEGASAGASLTYPLFSLASRWGGGIDFGYSNGVVRRFRGNELRPVPVTGEGLPPTTAPWTYRFRSTSFSAAVRRQFGRRVIQQVALGHSVSAARPSFVDDVPPDPRQRESFRAAVFPRSELISAPSLSWSLYTPRYRRYRDLDTFDLTESFVLGPSASASVAYSAPALGSDRRYLRVGAGLGMRADLAGGYQSITASASAYVQEGELVDQTISSGVYLATPMLAERVRLVATAAVNRYRRSTVPRYFTLGGDSGLRGYPVGEFLGDTAVIGHVEARSSAVPLASLRLGGVAFWDAGGAADRWQDVGLYHDVGVGLRLLIPQFNTYVLRLDCAFPLQSTFDETGMQTTKAGTPRVALGFRQGF